MDEVARFDVFLSYAHVDTDRARDLDTWLRGQGLRTFFDRTELTAGLRWVAALEQAIESSRAVAILVGGHGIGNTQQYERELAMVRQSRDASFPVIPVLLSGCEALPTGFLELLTWGDMRGGTNFLDQPTALSSLLAAIRQEAAVSAMIRSSVCPYLGLEPFAEEDAVFYFGRDRAARELVAKAGQYSLVAVVGPSGSGKSSLVFAGLLPELRRQRGATLWEAVSMRPGRLPLHALASTFIDDRSDTDPFSRDARIERGVAELRAGDSRMLARVITRRLEAAPERSDRLLLFIDQWEELYAMEPSADFKTASQQHVADVDRFIELVLGATAEGSPITAVLTVRADFYGSLIGNPHLARLLPGQQVNIGPMSQDDLRQAIVAPAKRAGLSFAPSKLVDQILEDVGTDEGMLPLMQFALRETWLRRQDGQLTAHGYTEGGGVRGALQTTAERTYHSLTEAQQRAARRLFLGLVSLGEGREDTRARIAMPTDVVLKEVVRRFSDRSARLLVTGSEQLPAADGGAADDAWLQATVEVAHEALIRTWPTLRGWLAENRDRLRSRAAVLQHRRDWETEGKIDTLLLPSGFQLQRGLALLADPGDVPVGDLRDYVELSMEREHRRIANEQREALEEQKRLADADRLAREAAEALATAERAARIAAVKQKRWAMFGTAIAVVLAVLAYSMQVAAQRSRGVANRALAVELGVKASYFARESGGGRIALVSALRGLSLTAPEDPAPPELTRGLGDSIAASRRIRLIGDGFLRFAEFTNNPDQVIGVETGELVIFRASTGEKMRAIPFSSKAVSAAFDRRNNEFLVLDDTGTMRRWSFSSNAWSTGVRLPTPFHDVYWSQDRSLLVLKRSGSIFETTAAYSLSTGKTIGNLRSYHDRNNAISTGYCDIEPSNNFSTSGTIFIASVGCGSFVPSYEVFDLQNAVSRGHPVLFAADAYSNGDLIAGISVEKKVVLLSASSLKEVRQFETCGEELSQYGARVSFSTDGRFLSVVGENNDVFMFDVPTGRCVHKLKGHVFRVTSIAYDEASSRLLTADERGVALVWNAETGALLKRLSGAVKRIDDARFDPSGQYVLIQDRDAYHVWNLLEGNHSEQLLHKDSVHAVEFAPDGSYAATASSDGTAIVWNLRENTRETLNHPTTVWSVSISADSKRIATAAADGVVRIWQKRESKLLSERKLHESALVVSFDKPGLRTISVGTEGLAKIWFPMDGRELSLPHRSKNIIAAVDAAGVSASFSADGRTAVTNDVWDPAAVWDANNGQFIRRLNGGISAAFDPSGKLLVTGLDEKAATVWNSSTLAEISSLDGIGGYLLDATFSDDGKEVAVASDDHNAYVFEAQSGTLIARLVGHEQRVRSVRFDNSGTRVVTASNDGTARIWDALNGAELFRLMGHSHWINSVRVSPDGRSVLTAGADGRVLKFPTTLAGFSALACTELRRLKVEVESSRMRDRSGMVVRPTDSMLPDLSTGNSATEAAAVAGSTERVVAQRSNTPPSSRKADSTVRQSGDPEDVGVDEALAYCGRLR